MEYKFCEIYNLSYTLIYKILILAIHKIKIQSAIRSLCGVLLDGIDILPHAMKVCLVVNDKVCIRLLISRFTLDTQQVPATATRKVDKTTFALFMIQCWA